VVARLDAIHLITDVDRKKLLLLSWLSKLSKLLSRTLFGEHFVT
jgi:hypothetical protein